MKTATVADLRNKFRLVSSWIEHGDTVQIIRRGKVFAQLIGVPREEARPAPKVDFMAQLKEVWGNRIFSDAEVQAMKEAERQGDLG